MKKFFKKSFSAVLAVTMIVCALFGAVSPNAATPKQAGDINGDENVDNKDVVALFRYLSGSADESTVDIIACDTNGDGNTDNKDVTTLFRYLNGADIEIFYGKDEPEQDLDNVFKLWDNTTKSTFGKANQTTVTVSDEGINLKYAKPSSSIDPRVTFDIAKYINLTGKPELSGKDGSFIVLKVKATTDGYMEIFTHSPAAGDASSATFTADGEFHYVIVDMTNTTFVEPEKLTTVRLDWAGADSANGATMVISEIGFFADLQSALSYTKLKEEDVYKEKAGILTFPSDHEVSDFVTSSDMKIEEGSDNGAKTAVATSKKTSPKVTINLRKLAELDNKAVKRGNYVAVRFKVSGQSDLRIKLQTVSDIAGIIKPVSQESPADCENNGWQGVMFNIRDIPLYEKEMSKLTITLVNFNTNGNIEIGGAVVSENINDALIACEHAEYCLNYDSALTDNDELAHTVLTADDEDATVKLWFDQSTEKTNRDDTESTGRTGFTVRMAKNEAENCQFFIAPEKTFKARIEIEDFKNANGDTVHFETFFEYYHNISSKLMPDAIPPLTEAIEIEGGKSQGFVLQFTTASDTPAGLYESVIHVYDDNTGKEIKRAAVAVKVWNFELSDKTELRTAFNIWGGYIEKSYSDAYWENSGYTQQQVYDNYFEFFLKYRINILNVSHGITSGYGNAYMSKDRVNTGGWYNYDMSVTEDNGFEPTWLNKVLYYPGDCDEPRTDEQFEKIISYANRIKANTPDYRMIIPIDRNLDLTNDGKIVSSFEEADTDQIGFMSQAVNVWCPKLDAFTTHDLGFISRTSFLQSEQQDAKYGTFLDRMKKEVEEGDELWTYVCINPTEPYTNWQLLSDGTEAIVSAWQMKDYGITGMLYWAVNIWKVNCWNQSIPWNSVGGAHGDGFLIYSGYNFGLPYPVSSLRLENIRDGIEDYQMLCMLEDVLGKEAADDMIHRITTSVVTYAYDDDYIHAVRVLLGDTLEEALNG